MTSYILTTPDTTTMVDERPKQTDLIAMGEGIYVLRRDDGSIIKTFTVARNRRGNLQLTHATPVDLDGISTLNLERVRKALTTAAKYWPAKNADIRKIEREITTRTALVSAAEAGHGAEVEVEVEVEVPDPS